MLKLGTIKQYSAAYPGYSGKESLQQISWDEFFEKFEESQLAFLYQDEKDSRFSKLVKRDTVEVEESGQPSARPVKASSREDPLQTLERDHQKVQGIFNEVQAHGYTKKQFEAIKNELEMHTKIEEEVFYPALKKVRQLKEFVEDAEAQHTLVKQLLADMSRQATIEFENDLKALIANVQLDIDEKETQIFPRVRDLANRLNFGKLAADLKAAKKANRNEMTDVGNGGAASEAGEFEEMTVTALYERAKDLDVQCRSNMTKQELIEAIQGKGDDLSSLSKKELTRRAKSLDIHGPTQHESR
jgi:hemerythrin HHE cation binding domain-containing protein/Rho termination factor-like protein